VIEYLELEDGSGHLLLEDGSGALLLETSTVPAAVPAVEGGGGNTILIPRRRRPPLMRPAPKPAPKKQPAYVAPPEHHSGSTHLSGGGRIHTTGFATFFEDLPFADQIQQLRLEADRDGLELNEALIAWAMKHTALVGMDEWDLLRIGNLYLDVVRGADIKHAIETAPQRAVDYAAGYLAHRAEADAVQRAGDIARLAREVFQDLQDIQDVEDALDAFEASDYLDSHETCELCRERPATVVLIEAGAGERHLLARCRDCANTNAALVPA
jgi:hypothetical protein